jgi:signal recognition particle GTPase
MLEPSSDFAREQRSGLALRFVGVGEGIDEPHAFAAREFVSALLD